jgi:hypothetical protein
MLEALAVPAVPAVLVLRNLRTRGRCSSRPPPTRTHRQRTRVRCSFRRWCRRLAGCPGNDNRPSSGLVVVSLQQCWPTSPPRARARSAASSCLLPARGARHRHTQRTAVVGIYRSACLCNSNSSVFCSEGPRLPKSVFTLLPLYSPSCGGGGSARVWRPQLCRWPICQ